MFLIPDFHGELCDIIIIIIKCLPAHGCVTTGGSSLPTQSKLAAQAPAAAPALPQQDRERWRNVYVLSLRRHLRSPTGQISLFLIVQNLSHGNTQLQDGLGNVVFKWCVNCQVKHWDSGGGDQILNSNQLTLPQYPFPLSKNFSGIIIKKRKT